MCCVQAGAVKKKVHHHALPCFSLEHQEEPVKDLPFQCVGQMIVTELHTLLSTHINSAIACSVIHSAACLYQHALVPCSDRPQTDDSDARAPLILQIQQQH